MATPTLPDLASLAAMGAALIVSALSVWAAIYFVLGLGRPRSQRDARATLVLPLTGPADGLEDLIGHLNRQTLAPRRLLIAVESAHDPAFQRAHAMAPLARFAVEVVVAGLAERCAQKCANQIAALRRIEAGDEAVVLLDADIRPQDWWLSALVSPLKDGAADIVTGYRWAVPAHRDLASHTVASIDRGIAILPRFSFSAGVWGGSVAFTPASMARMGLLDALATTVSDDLTLGEQAQAAGLHILHRRALLVPTPTHWSLAGAWRFGRRQYQMIRLHRPRLWQIANAAIWSRLAGWTAVIVHAGSSPFARVVGVGLVACAVVVWACQQLAIRRLGLAEPAGGALVQLALAIGKPLVDLAHGSMVLGAAATRFIGWGHVTYRADGPRSIVVEERNAWPS